MSKQTKEYKYHYTYRITNIVEQKYYYGVHSCNCLPKEEIGISYFSSASAEFKQDQKDNPQNYKYKVVKLFNTREEAVEHEIFLHKKFDVKLHKKFYNEANQTSTGFDTAGKVTVKDKNGNTLQVSKDDERLLSVELVGVTKGFVTVKDKDGNIFSVSKDDPRWLSGELVGVTKGFVTVKDKDNNIFSVSVKDNRYISGELKHVSSSIIQSKDKDGNIFSVSKDDPRWLSGELVGVIKGRVTVKDKDGNILQVSKDDERLLSGKLVAVNKGKIPVKDKYGNKFQVSKDDERYLSGELVHVNKGVIVICPHCKKTGGIANMKRYHFENCKQNLKLRKEMQVEKQKISEHKRTRNSNVSASADRKYVPKSVQGMGMYTVVINDGKRKYSVTKHCSELEIERFIASFK